MKNILLFCICLFGAASSLPAQQPDAREILDRTATAFRQAGGIESNFTIDTHRKGTPVRTSAGLINLKGEKFFLNAEGVKTWFDGRTQWSYLVDSDEVNISDPTPEELQSINPYVLLSIYKQGYSAKLGTTATYEGKPVYEVVLTASGKQQDLQSIILYVTKDRFQPLYVKMTQKGGDYVIIRVTSYQPGQTYNDALFVFDKRTFPTAEVIDLR
ncbi:LolA-like putative outer membrane lipoprotein chaperone [Bacteroides sp. UBA939]|uniref:LolA-like putative outer membrane lipoprotein chaperone n=1 Tax=Bacteroides sp. UBA939 TaxID=1946092 RepID=UPI0025BC4A73|nr:LolA-like putative outer membrane lipoprotein chaperone [Bacteroides sp. UBA939]